MVFWLEPPAVMSHVRLGLPHFRHWHVGGLHLDVSFADLGPLISDSLRDRPRRPGTLISDSQVQRVCVVADVVD